MSPARVGALVGVLAVQAVALGALLGAIAAPPWVTGGTVLLACAGAGVAAAVAVVGRSPVQAAPTEPSSEAPTLDLRQRDDRMRELLADLAHDVRTPLASLKLGLQRLPESPELGPLRAEVEHLDGMFTNVASMVQLETTSIPLAQRVQPLAPLVQRVVLRLTVLASDRGVALDSATDGVEHLHAKVDPVAFEQMLGNLVSNAIKFCEAHVAVLLEDDEEAGEAVIRVLDDGPGIATIERPRVLERRYRSQGAVDRGRPGQGLGLAIATALAERHGGSLALRPNADGGTCAELRLPLAAADTWEGR
jgi:signal transduction histidine kinase